MDRLVSVTPESILEAENKGHDHTGYDGNPSRDNVSLNQIFAHGWETTIVRLGVDREGEPEKSRDARAWALISRLKNFHNFQVWVHWLRYILFSISPDCSVPALLPRCDAIWLSGNTELSRSAWVLSAAVVGKFCLGNIIVTLIVTVRVAGALWCAHPAVNLVKHVSVEVAAFHEWLRLRSILFSTGSRNRLRHVYTLESEDATDDEHDEGDWAKATAVQHDKAAFLHLNNDTAEETHKEANDGSNPKQSQANVLGHLEFRGSDIVGESPAFTLINDNARYDDSEAAEE